MNTEGGYVRLYRRIWGNPVFGRKQEAAMFVWMISEAQWQERTIPTQYGPVKLYRGEVLVAERTLSWDFGFHRNTIRRLFRRLCDDGMIEVVRDRANPNAGTVVYIKNYNSYQQVEQLVDVARDHGKSDARTTSGPPQDHLGTKNKEEKEGKKGEEESAVPPEPVGVSVDLFQTAAIIRMPPDDVTRAVELWNEMAAPFKLPRIVSVNSQRRRGIRRCLADGKGPRGETGLVGWRLALAAVAASPWWRGEVKASFVGNIDSMIVAKSYQKLLEGAYPAGSTAAGLGRNRYAGLEDYFAEPARQPAPEWDLEGIAEVAS